MALYIDFNLKISLSLALATFSVLNSLMWLVATVLDKTAQIQIISIVTESSIGQY